MRHLLLTAALLSSTSALASGRPGPRGPHPAPRCAPSELRLSTPDNAWYDVQIDGVTRFEARNQRSVEALGLAPGRHFVRVTDFMGDTWSEHTLDVGCADVVVGEVRDNRGLRVLTSFSERPARPAHRPPPPAQRPAPPARRPAPPPRHRTAPPRRVCEPGALTISPVDNTWYDVYVDGEKLVESRNFDGSQTIGGLAPGRHHVRVESFVGESWSSHTVDIPCSGSVHGEVREDRGLRLY